MQVRWSVAALQDFSRIIEYILRDNASAADRVAAVVFEAVDSLAPFPYRGRRGRLEGTRELVLPSLPFIVVYRIAEEAVEIAGVIHGAQRWPPGP
jgi:toxin ParE1/3/4